MLRLELLDKAIDDCKFWALSDRKLLVKSIRLFEECRMIYQVTDEFIIVHSLRGHYE